LKRRTQEDASEATLLLLEAVLTVAGGEEAPFLTWRKDSHRYCFECGKEWVTPATGETGMVTLFMDKNTTTNKWNDLSTLLTNQLGGGEQSEVDFKCPCDTGEKSNLWSTLKTL
ncbi:unnamed protein product, partial [Ectocarpus fasciculatus]